jgi:hypothetical protein
VSNLHHHKQKNGWVNRDLHVDCVAVCGTWASFVVRMAFEFGMASLFFIDQFPHHFDKSHFVPSRSSLHVMKKRVELQSK